MNNQTETMTDEEVSALLDNTNPASNLPMVISKVYYQPTTGIFWSASNPIEITELMLVTVMPIMKKIIIESPAKAVLSSTTVTENELATHSSALEIAKSKLGNLGYKIYSTTSLSIIGLAYSRACKQTKQGLEPTGDFSWKPVKININSQSSLPDNALSSITEIFANQKNSVSNTILTIRIDDEPLVTKVNQRKLYPISFTSSRNSTVTEKRMLIEKQDNDLVINHLMDSGNSSKLNMPPLMSIQSIITPLALDIIIPDDNRCNEGTSYEDGIYIESEVSTDLIK